MSSDKILPHNSDTWDGYTIDEIRYLRAYTAARLEISRERLQRNASEMVESANPLANGHSILSRMLGTMNYLDIALITFKVGRGVFKFIRRLRR